MNYFSHGRTALKYGLKYLDLNKDDIILMPNYICDVVLSPLIKLNIKILFYEISDNMQPDWDQLNAIINSKVKALMIVHYFGFSQDLDKTRKFCDRNNLFLIEDNAHGHGGKYKGQLLGTFGDIGFSSPRKLYPIDFGGILFTKKEKLVNDLPSPPFLNKMKKIIKRRTDYYFSNNKYHNVDESHLDSNEIKQNIISDMSIDNKSLQILKKINYDKIKEERSIIYNYWEKFALDNGLQPVYNKLQNSIIPWSFPAYTLDLNERNKWLIWGYKNNLMLYSWPRLPISLLDEKENVLDRWNRLICFPINHGISIKQLKKITK